MTGQISKNKCHRACPQTCWKLRETRTHHRLAAGSAVGEFDLEVRLLEENIHSGGDAYFVCYRLTRRCKFILMYATDVCPIKKFHMFIRTHTHYRP